MDFFRMKICKGDEILLILYVVKILADINTRKADILIFLCFLLAAALLTWAAVTAWLHFKTTPPYVDTNLYPVAGIDISAHNDIVDLKAAKKEGIEFTWIKASEGVDFRDRKFTENHRLAGEAGMMRGAYHFFRFDRDGIEQALNLMGAVGDRELEMGIAIDVESSGNPEGIAPEEVTEKLLSMIDYLKLRGYGVTVYCNKNDYYRYLSEGFPGSALWICSFSSDPIAAEWRFWQYSHSGTVAGINGKVDLNVYGGSREEWNAFISQQQYQGEKSVY